MPHTTTRPLGCRCAQYTPCGRLILKNCLPNSFFTHVASPRCLVQPHFREGKPSPPFRRPIPSLSFHTIPFPSVLSLFLPPPHLRQEAAAIAVSFFQLCPGQSPGRNSILVYFEVMRRVWNQPFWFFLWEPKISLKFLNQNWRQLKTPD